MLSTTERWLGDRALGAPDRSAPRRALEIPDRHQILLTLALGRPPDVVALEPTGPDRDMKYHREGDGMHAVPKRPLEELIFHEWRGLMAPLALPFPRPNAQQG
jgi:hypothetical protein